MAMQDRVEEAVRHGRRVIEKYGEQYWIMKELGTRFYIIDPVLRALGWQLNDPDQCRFEEWRERGADEYKGQLDYALYSGGKPVVLIETKSLKTGLNGYSQENQLARYKRSGEMVGVLTNGQEWYFYDLPKTSPFAYKCVNPACPISILDQDTNKVASRLTKYMRRDRDWQTRIKPNP